MECGYPNVTFERTAKGRQPCPDHVRCFRVIIASNDETPKKTDQSLQLQSIHYVHIGTLAFNAILWFIQLHSFARYVQEFAALHTASMCGLCTDTSRIFIFIKVENEKKKFSKFFALESCRALDCVSFHPSPRYLTHRSHCIKTRSVLYTLHSLPCCCSCKRTKQVVSVLTHTSFG